MKNGKNCINTELDQGIRKIHAKIMRIGEGVGRNREINRHRDEIPNGEKAKTEISLNSVKCSRLN